MLQSELWFTMNIYHVVEGSDHVENLLDLLLKQREPKPLGLHNLHKTLE